MLGNLGGDGRQGGLAHFLVVVVLVVVARRVLAGLDQLVVPLLGLVPADVLALYVRDVLLVVVIQRGPVFRDA